jgi:hypothetical protein
VARRWRRAIEAADRVIIFSPFITLGAVSFVFGEKLPRQCDVYTVFRAEYFACGSSSLDALRHLLKMGARLYQVRLLHAKVLIVPGQFASVGSQNLTGQGRRNREATVVFTNQQSVERIEQLASRWIEEAVEIEREQLDEMEAAVEPLKAKCEEVAKAAARVDEQVRRSERPRVFAEPVSARDGHDFEEEDEDEEEGQAQLDSDEDRFDDEGEGEFEQEEEWPSDPTQKTKAPNDIAQDLADADEEDSWSAGDARSSWLRTSPGAIHQLPSFPADRLASFREAIARAPKAREVIDAEVRLLDGKPRLVGRADAKLTTWLLGGGEVVLKRNYRYMCILEGVCQWGWARVAGTRITFITQRLTLSEPVLLAHFKYLLWFEAVWDYTAEPRGNLKVMVTPEGDTSLRSPLATLDCWFGLDCLHIFDVSICQAPATLYQPEEADRLREWLVDNGPAFKATVLPHVLAPFKYEANLCGLHADSFFGPPGTRVALRLARIEGHEVLVARTYR